MSRFLRRTGWTGGLLVAALVAGCSQGRPVPTGPSAVGDVTAAGPGGGATVSSSHGRGGGPAPLNGSTTVGFSGFNQTTLTVDMNTSTTSSVGQPYIDQGKIQLQILVDSSGQPVPCGTAGATYVRFDGAGGGITVSGGATSTSVDLDNLEATTGGVVKNVSCGDSICIRAHYVTGGGQTKVDTHDSAPTPYEVVCAPEGCTLTQGYWKNHYPEDWPGSVLDTGMTLGTVTYTAAQLVTIFNQPPAGNGLISLAHQLIAAKLNIANGANGSAVAAAIAAADALIGTLVVPPVGSGSLASSATSALTQTLDDYNKGLTGPGHCD